MNAASLYALLAQLWLHEPDELLLAQTRALPTFAIASHDTDLTTLAAAYADLFLLNVYPYGTAFTDEYGELNTPEAMRVAELFATHGYAPRELNEVGAPDHLGLCLGFMAQLHLTPQPPLLAGEHVLARFCNELLRWGPVCCLAAERDPTAQPFYRALAQLTREKILEIDCPMLKHRFAVSNDQVPSTKYQVPMTHHQSPDDEVHLRDLVRFFLAPTRCGLFLSRARLGQLARTLNMRLPFGSRFEVAEWLFVSAGQSEALQSLLAALRAEAEVWATEYRAWAQHYPAWQPYAAQWLERIAHTQRTLDEMEQVMRADAA